MRTRGTLALVLILFLAAFAYAAYDGMPVNDTGFTTAEKIRVQMERCVQLKNTRRGLVEELEYWQTEPVTSRVTAIINGINAAISDIDTRVSALRTEMKS